MTSHSQVSNLCQSHHKTICLQSMKMFQTIILLRVEVYHEISTSSKKVTKETSNRTTLKKYIEIKIKIKECHLGISEHYGVKEEIITLF